MVLETLGGSKMRLSLVRYLQMGTRRDRLAVGRTSFRHPADQPSQDLREAENGRSLQRLSHVSNITHK